MANEQREDNKDAIKDLNNVEVTELEDKDLEDASGGLTETGKDTGGNYNCGC